ncbi:MAG: hypothetical protein H6819_10875 [Phycisphaerales bacterium]|nr:hypothetical protein [Phycisphaerales bacterium]MCB9855612.1 hypothetical protein [Phycisphaerales bacterium]
MAGGVESINQVVLLLASLPPMGGAYVVALVVGGGLVLISALFGGSSHHDVDLGGVDAHGDLDLGGDVDVPSDLDAAGDFDADADLDVDTDAVDLDGAGMHLADWFSLRFVIYFAAMFGLTGTVLTTMTDMGRMGVLIASIVGGLIVGQAVHQTMRWLRRSSSDSSTRTIDYLNRPGRVTVSIRAGGRGEVAIQVFDGERCLPAIAQRDDEEFAIGSQVAIVEVRGGTAVVVSRREHDFLAGA